MARLCGCSQGKMSISGITFLEERQCSPAVRKMQLHSRLRCSDSPIWVANQLYYSLYNRYGRLITSYWLGYKASGQCNDRERKSAVGALPLFAELHRDNYLSLALTETFFIPSVHPYHWSSPPNCLFKLPFLLEISLFRCQCEESLSGHRHRLHWYSS